MSSVVSVGVLTGGGVSTTTSFATTAGFAHAGFGRAGAAVVRSLQEPLEWISGVGSGFGAVEVGTVSSFTEVDGAVTTESSSAGGAGARDRKSVV